MWLAIIPSQFVVHCSVLKQLLESLELVLGNCSLNCLSATTFGALEIHHHQLLFVFGSGSEGELA